MNVKILPQPDDVTCGPTSLHAIYHHYGYQISLHRLISEIEMLEGGGTLGVFLGLDALKRGFDATIHSVNLEIFDPTWVNLSMEALADKLRQEYAAKHRAKLRVAIKAYLRFIELGGIVSLKDFKPGLFDRYFKKNVPLIAGVSTTFLYQSKREYTNSDNMSVFDDIHGDPMGHFVVVYGENEEKKFLIADPDCTNPIAHDHYYAVERNRLVHSILLGILTYDSLILAVQPKKK
ncbi:MULTISPECIES: peptidase-C39 like family protein [Hallerella]|uniref:Peptidase-C39 like family protein n=1 Tax=Hallerella succinigenes TaxID=1896222 RepID=A0A2M9AA70_9BACT|nr:MULTISPECIES: peptidase-C39 like family protein [Hallerella]MBS7390816.1 peptidase-C39 like family protein [Fibrobacter sp.]MDD6092948.1 peptidase-C39 like family protein [Hallerella succinigenes]MDY5028886.1 peptidase-C39 like family protein [Hallerella succinigenes]PJJ42626.1 hypothetical protein BGX16_2663 [Hallerella succinigenes]